MGCKMKYIKSAAEEYIVIVGEGEDAIGVRGSFNDAKKEAEEMAEKANKPVYINKLVGYIDPFAR